MSKFNEERDVNGRFLSPEAYLPKTIGGSIIEIFGGMNMPRDAGLDCVNVLLGREPSEHCSNPNVLDGITRLGLDIKDMFIEGKTTETEFNAGLEYLLAECKQFPDTASIDTAIAELEAIAKKLGASDDDIKALH